MENQNVDDETPALPPIDIPTDAECLKRLGRHILGEKKHLTESFFQYFPAVPAGTTLEDHLMNLSKDPGGLSEDLKKLIKNSREMITSLINDQKCRQAEIALDLSVLTLYDLAIFIDDSPSMGRREHKRILANTMKEICKIYSLANTDGIKAVRFLNHRQGKKNVKLSGVSDVMGRCAHTGLSRIGTELHRRVLDTLVLKAAMSKPLLVVIVTDGTVEGESGTLLPGVIVNCVTNLIKKTRSRQSVAFQFCRIGDDPEAIRFLDGLDNHPKLGDHIDCMTELFSLKNIPDSDELGNILAPSSPSSDISDVGLNPPDPTKWVDERWNVMCKLFLGPLMEHWDDYDDPMDENNLGTDENLDILDKGSKDLFEDNE